MSSGRRSNRRASASVREEPIRLTELGSLHWYGTRTPIHIGIDLTPGLARSYRDPSGRCALVDRLTKAIAELYTYRVSRALSREELRERIEAALGARYGQPGQTVVDLAKLRDLPLGPVVDLEPEFVPSVGGRS